MSNNRSWLDQARELLDVSARDLDATTLSRLNRARRRASEASAQRRSRRVWPAAGLATACALLLTLLLSNPRDLPQPQSTLPLTSQTAGATDESEWVSDEDNLDLVQDLEFYAWLDTQDEDVNG